MSFLGSAINSIGNVLTGGASGGTTAAAGAADPFASQRGQYQTMLSNLMANPSSITQLPGYKFEFDQGMQALMRSDAASGNFGGGKMSTDAIQFGQGLAETSFNNWEGILANLSGVNAGNPAAAASLLASGAQQQGGPLGSLLGSGLNWLTGSSSGIGTGGALGDAMGWLGGAVGGLFGGGAAAGTGAAGAGSADLIGLALA